MANENDVVRLKHLQPLVSGVANDFSIQNGDDAVRLKHLVSLASALDNDKQMPVLSLGSWSAVDSVYSAAITYDGDGTLSTNLGTINNNTLIVPDADGTFSGAVIASEGNNFAPTKLVFSRSVETVGGSGKRIPTLSVTADDFGGLPNTITYDGDGTLKAFQDNGNEYSIINNEFYANSTHYGVVEHGYVLASETANCAPVWAEFTVYGGQHPDPETGVDDGDDGR